MWAAMSSHADTPDDAPKPPARVKPHQLALVLGIAMGIFILVSGILPQITGWENENPVHRTVFVNYCIVLVGMGVFSAASWRYATKDGRLINPGTDPAVVQNLWIDALIEPIAATAAMAIALVSVEAGQAALLVIPLAFAAQRWRRRRKTKSSA